MHKILLIIALLLVPIALQNIYAESFDFEYYTGEIFEIHYELQDVTLTKLSTTDESIIFNLNSISGKLFVSFPKAIPLQTSEGLDYPLFVAIHDGSGYSPEIEKTTKFLQTATDCTFEVEFNFDNKAEKVIQIDIDHGFLAAGPSLTYVDLPEHCLEDDPRNDTKLQRTLNEKQCSHDDYHKGLNFRDDTVCVSPESYPLLQQRGYLKTFTIIKMIPEYP